MHQGHVGDTQPVQQNRHRVHQHGGLIGDNLQRWTEAARIVTAVDPNQGFTGPALMRQISLRRDQLRRHRNLGFTGFVGMRNGTGVRAPVGGFVSIDNGAVNRHTVGHSRISVRTDAGTRVDHISRV